MRILLVLDRVENAASANALMGLRLAEQLLARDHTVHILTLWGCDFLWRICTRRYEPLDLLNNI